MGFDLKVTGATAFFSWPSLGMTSAYTADEDTIQVSVDGHRELYYRLR